MKIDLLRAWVFLHKPNIITISETWLHNNIADDMIKIEDYVLYRSDRTSRGHRVATYVSAFLDSEHVIPSIGPVNFECLFVKVTLHANKNLTIGNIYRPPSAPSDSMMCILSTINSREKHNELIILGDFNRNWLDRSSVNDTNLLGSLNLCQLINVPTRVDQRSSSLLDWILVTNPERIITSGVLSDCLSDHSIIYCVWKIKIPSAPPKYIMSRQYKNLNIDNFIQDLLDINWNRFQ